MTNHFGSEVSIPDHCFLPGLLQVPITHSYLDDIMKPLQELQDDVTRKALTRLTFENLHQHEYITRPGATFYGNPEGFAMSRYCYYQCYKCHQVILFILCNGHYNFKKS